MALSALRLRRALRPLSTAAALRFHLPPPPSSTFLPSKSDLSLRSINDSISRSHATIGFAPFHSSASLLDRRSDPVDGKIDPNEILFEGCDYNHWLITMDFPKDQNITPEEMVETYVQTLTKVVGSREEAMKRMYACSTTTYTGFQAVMTEEMSEKFRGLPGVVFILPDSYIDPVNKEYGGDKYEMGKITPRPPPVQYGRQGRYGDRNRGYDRPRYDQPRDSFRGQENQSFNRQGPVQGDGRNYTHHNYNPVGQGGLPYERQGSMQADGRGHAPSQNYNMTGQQGGMQYDQRGPPQPDLRNYAPPQNYNSVEQQRAIPYDRPSPVQGEGRYHAQQNYYPGGQQGSVSYAQQGPVPVHGTNYPTQQRYNPSGPNTFYGQQGNMTGDARYQSQQSYGPPSATTSEPRPFPERRDYNQYAGGGQENFDSRPNNQGQH